WSP
ncbi:WD repeat-containing protein 92, partial [Trichonephila inaurata madagascariensis]